MLLSLHRLMTSTIYLDFRHALNEGHTATLVLQLLLGPISTHSKNVLVLLDLPSGSSSKSNIQCQKSSNLGGNYTDLLFLQPYNTRRQVAHTFISTAVRACKNSKFFISSLDGVNFALGEIANVMVMDQVDGGLFGTMKEDDVVDWEDASEEQINMAKFVHVIQKTRSEHTFNLLMAARDHLIQGGNIRIRFPLVPIVVSMLDLVKPQAETDVVATNVLKAVYETIGIISRAREAFTEEDEEFAPLSQDGEQKRPSSIRLLKGLKSPPDMALHLYLLASQYADIAKEEEMCYEFFVQALTIYEEAVSESKAQYNSITQIIVTLSGRTCFGVDNYETLITKCAVHCARLLKRVDQCRGVTLASHLFWADDKLPRDEGRPAYRDAKRVLECLQKALKIADSVMDRNTSISLFIEILERYLWYFERRNEIVTSC